MGSIITTDHKTFFLDAAEKLAEISGPDGIFLDIGGGLRVSKDRGDHYDAWGKKFGHILDKTQYRILDTVATYRPHYVGNVMNLNFKDNAIGAVWCNSVLEHVPEPQLAVKELHRVIKKGGGLFIYVPFLFRYHPKNGYYADFFRFTEDGVKYLIRDFEKYDLIELGGRFYTLGHLFPNILGKIGKKFGNIIDNLLSEKYQVHHKNTKGFACICIK